MEAIVFDPSKVISKFDMSTSRPSLVNPDCEVVMKDGVKQAGIGLAGAEISSWLLGRLKAELMACGTTSLEEGWESHCCVFFKMDMYWIEGPILHLNLVTQQDPETGESEDIALWEMHSSNGITMRIPTIMARINE